MLLFLLFLMWVGILFLNATGEVSVGVAVRSQLARVCDEIALNIARAGLDEAALQAGVVAIDINKANTIANEAFARWGIPAASFTAQAVNGQVVVTVARGNISSTGAAAPRKLRVLGGVGN